MTKTNGRLKAFCEISVLRNLIKFAGRNIPVMESIFNEFAGC